MNRQRNHLSGPWGHLLILAGHWLILVLTTLAVACGPPPEGETAVEAPPADRSAPVSDSWDGVEATEVLDEAGVSLGSVALTASCAPEASTEILRGLALLHNMTHTEAETAFRRATESDPGCALGYWGQAMSYVHPVWPDVPSQEEFTRGWALLQEARGAGLVSDREEAWVEALEAYYLDGAARTEPARLADYAAAWARVVERFPDDLEARLFQALTLIATAPGGDTTFTNQIRAGEIAEAVLAAVPDHPGAHHYVIHAYDVPPLAERALAAARSYGRVSPENAHALHMTSHIFTRLGLWEESIAFNLRSAEAALSHPVAGAASHHHLHALDYLAYAYLQQGADSLARGVRDQLDALEGPLVDNAVTAYAFAAVPVRIALERRDWAAAARIPAGWPGQLSWNQYPHLEAIVRFGNALGAAHRGDIGAAEAAVERLDALQKAASALPGRYDWGTQVEIQALGAQAWLAYAGGHEDRALALMRNAARLESTAQKHPVTPSEVLPASDLLGDMLLAMGRPAEAREAYQATLQRSPNRLNSLYGSKRAAELAGDEQATHDDYRHLLALTGEGSALPQVARAKGFLDRE